MRNLPHAAGILAEWTSTFHRSSDPHRESERALPKLDTGLAQSFSYRPPEKNFAELVERTNDVSS
jgi:hypothetical protein